MFLKILLYDGIFYILILIGCVIFYHALKKRRFKLGTVMIVFFVSLSCICRNCLFFDNMQEDVILGTYPVDSYSTDGMNCYYTEENMRKMVPLTTEHIRYEGTADVPYIEDVRYEEYVGLRYLIPGQKIGEKTIPRIVISEERLEKIQNNFSQI